MPVDTKPGDSRERRRLMMAGGIGFFTGAALWEVAFGEHGARTWSVWRQITFVPATIVVVWISLRLLHPFYERVYVGAQSPRHRSAEFQSGIILLAVLGGVLETLLHTALWEGEAVGWGQLVGGLVYGAAITGAWIRGLRTGSTGPAMRGARVGATLGFVLGFIAGLDETKVSEGLAVAAWRATITGLRVALLPSLIGFLGGVTLEGKEERTNPGIQITWAALIAAVLSEATIALLRLIGALPQIGAIVGRAVATLDWRHPSAIVDFLRRVLAWLPDVLWLGIGGPEFLLSLIRSMLIAVSFGLFLWLYQPSEHLLRKSMPAAAEGGPP